MWNHCEIAPPQAFCLNAGIVRIFVGGDVSMMKHHLAGTKENVSDCTCVPDEVKEMSLKMLENKESAKEANNLV